MKRRTGQELLLNGDSLGDNLPDSVRVRPALQVAEQEASEVGVHTLITADELVGEGETGHQTTLLQPEDGREGTGEEDTLDGGEGDQTFAKGRVLITDPSESPLGLLLDAWDGLDSIEQELALSWVLDISIDEQ